MKKVFTAMTALLLLAVMVLSLASCTKKPSGKYGSETMNLEFSGDKVTLNVKILTATTSLSGTYTMDDDGKIKIVWEDNDNKVSVPSGLSYDADNDVIKSTTGDLKKMK